MMQQVFKIISLIVLATCLCAPLSARQIAGLEPVLIGSAKYGQMTPRLAVLRGKGYRTGDAALPFFQVGRVLTAYNPLGEVWGKPFTVTRLVPADGGQDSTLETIPTMPDRENASLLVVSGLPAQPKRSVRGEKPTDTDRQRVRSYLKAQGIVVKEPHITQKIVADLDGDGQSETVVTADAGADKNGVLKNWYSAVILYSANAKRTILASQLVKNSGEAEGIRYYILGVPDIDGDGKREILLEINGWEFSDIIVHAWRSKKVARLTGGE